MPCNAYEYECTWTNPKGHKTIGDVTMIKKQESDPTRKINHWWIKRSDSERMVKRAKDTPTPTGGKATNV